MARRKRNQKQSDETLVDIVEVRDQAQSFFDENQNLVFGALVVVVLLVGGFFAYRNFYQKPRQQEAVEQMFRAQQQFERDSFALALTNPGGGYMGFLDVIDSYKGTKAANAARYYTGVSYLNLGKYEAAIDYLKQYKANDDVTPITKYGAMGDAYSELQDFDQAMSFYKKAVKAGDNAAITPYYLKKMGMLHEKNGNFAEAKKAYEEIKEKYSDSSVGADIDKYIARVESKG
jgi:tetratricopeptide (TPR) repeat protein